MLSPKQIGTICFAISILISAPLFATDIPSSASTADCKHTPLQVYSGTSNLEAGWTANTIALHWYNGDTEIQNVPVASQSCVYDGTLTPPSTIPTKTGYTFKGWRVRQASNDCFASSVCGLTGSAINGLEYSDYGSNSLNGLYTKNISTYGLTSTGSWAVEFSNGGIVRGIANCNNTSSNTYDTVIAQVYSEGTMTEEQAWSEIWGSCNSDAIKPSSTFNTSSSGQYCWCKMTSWTPSGGSACNIASPSWVFEEEIRSTDDCAYDCADYCATHFSGIVSAGSTNFRRALFGVSQ